MQQKIILNTISKTMNLGGSALVSVYDAGAGIFNSTMSALSPGEKSKLRTRIKLYEKKIQSLYGEIGRESSKYPDPAAALESNSVKALLEAIKEHTSGIEIMKQRIIELEEIKAARVKPKPVAKPEAKKGQHEKVGVAAFFIKSISSSIAGYLPGERSTLERSIAENDKKIQALYGEFARESAKMPDPAEALASETVAGIISKINALKTVNETLKERIVELAAGNKTVPTAKKAAAVAPTEEECYETTAAAAPLCDAVDVLAAAGAEPTPVAAIAEQSDPSTTDYTRAKPCTIPTPNLQPPTRGDIENVTRTLQPEPVVEAVSADLPPIVAEAVAVVEEQVASEVADVIEEQVATDVVAAVEEQAASWGVVVTDTEPEAVTVVVVEEPVAAEVSAAVEEQAAAWGVVVAEPEAVAEAEPEVPAVIEEITAEPVVQAEEVVAAVEEVVAVVEEVAAVEEPLPEAVAAEEELLDADVIELAEELTESEPSVTTPLQEASPPEAPPVVETVTPVVDVTLTLEVPPAELEKKKLPSFDRPEPEPVARGYFSAAPDEFSKVRTRTTAAPFRAQHEPTHDFAAPGYASTSGSADASGPAFRTRVHQNVFSTIAAVPSAAALPADGAPIKVKVAEKVAEAPVYRPAASVDSSESGPVFRTRAHQQNPYLEAAAAQGFTPPAAPVVETVVNTSEAVAEKKEPAAKKHAEASPALNKTSAGKASVKPDAAAAKAAATAASGKNKPRKRS
ncbi:MAG TPA: hypothetical protein HPP94_07280 [Desulfuromonadales bacterium]|nr:hypothetical protein [Desulfuromonadales bacterium]